MKLRISPTDSIQGLWSDRIDWHASGQLGVRRASYVEFHKPVQKWVVRAWRPRGWARRVLQRLTGRPSGEVLAGGASCGIRIGEPPGSAPQPSGPVLTVSHANSPSETTPARYSQASLTSVARR